MTINEITRRHPNAPPTIAAVGSSAVPPPLNTSSVFEPSALIVLLVVLANVKDAEVAIDVGGGDRARALLGELESRGVFIRMPAVAPMDRCVRVSVGLPDERAIFAERFADALKAL